MGGANDANDAGSSRSSLPVVPVRGLHSTPARKGEKNTQKRGQLGCSASTAVQIGASELPVQAPLAREIRPKCAVILEQDPSRVP